MKNSYRFEVVVHGDPDVVTNDGIFGHAANEAPALDFAGELELHDELRFDLDHDRVLPTGAGDKPDEGPIIHRNRDV